MKTKILICLLVILLGGAQASLHMKQHHSQLDHSQELLQTKAKTEVAAAATVTTTTETATEAGAEAECDPDCLYKFPYLDSECAARPDEPVEPVPVVEEGETFVLDAEACYTFDITIEEPPVEPTETFVVDAEGCYGFEIEVQPPHVDETLVHIIEECFHEEPPKPTPGPSDESCDEPSHIYRYPFVHPGGDCDVVVDETTETIVIINENVPLDGEVIVTVDEDGETSVVVIDEHGEDVTPINPDEVVTVDEGAGDLSSDDEHGETWTPINPDEVVTVDEGTGELSSDDEHGETWTPINPDEVVTVDEGTGELSSDDEHGETWTPINPDEVITIDEGSGEEIIPPYNVDSSDEEEFIVQAEACYTFEIGSDSSDDGELIVIVDEYEASLPTFEEVVIHEGEGEAGGECIIGDTYESGTTIIYEQPTTYITWNRWDIHNHHHVSYTYVLTNIYSGVFKTDEYHYVIYGAGAINFYNTYYGIDAHVHDTPSCSCTCGYQTYTFTYQFGL